MRSISRRKTSSLRRNSTRAKFRRHLYTYSRFSVDSFFRSEICPFFFHAEWLARKKRRKFEMVNLRRNDTRRVSASPLHMWGIFFTIIGCWRGESDTSNTHSRAPMTANSIRATTAWRRGALFAPCRNAPRFPLLELQCTTRCVQPGLGQMTSVSTLEKTLFINPARSGPSLWNHF